MMSTPPRRDKGMVSSARPTANFVFKRHLGMDGGSFDAEFLRFSGRPTIILAWALPGFYSLEKTRPLVRQELYELRCRQLD